jgi:hypothetical protein
MNNVLGLLLCGAILLVSIEASRANIYTKRKPVSKCAMHAKSCQIEALISRPTDAQSLYIKSNADRILTFESIHACEPSDNSTACLSAVDPDASQTRAAFNLTENDGRQLSLYVIKFKSVLIGNASLQFYSKAGEDNSTSEEDLLYEHEVVVTAPRRLVDILFDIYIWTSNTIISLCRFRINSSKLDEIN